MSQRNQCGGTKKHEGIKMWLGSSTLFIILNAVIKNRVDCNETLLDNNGCSALFCEW